MWRPTSIATRTKPHSIPQLRTAWLRPWGASQPVAGVDDQALVKGSSDVFAVRVERHEQRGWYSYMRGTAASPVTASSMV